MEKKINPDLFKKITKLVIDKLEGGYFHPDMFTDGRLNPKYYTIYSKSGETMLGLDRFAGFSLFYSGERNTNDIEVFIYKVKNGRYNYKNEASKKFWTIIDNSKASKLWSWNYKGGSNYNQLSDLAAEIMLPVFNNYADKYLTDPARDIVFNTPELLFNFSYASWNGPAFFQYYADSVNNAIDQGIKNPARLSDIALDRRINGPNYKLPRSGKIMQDLFKSAEWADLKKKSEGINIFPFILIGAGLALFLTYKLIFRGKS